MTQILSDLFCYKILEVFLKYDKLEYDYMN